ncbi:uncharacterized protein LOC123010468 isoform X2 [Tribolium madens]|uniref:uncharacterized protein LOC123010468 isoform X2 n=1 Tax=Tribolium madens TaxID=41895 RepID=UPI001CF72E81|nr:uncharacterized protein LOC123010468 isoform X2 [Tribolium madens]
MTERLRASSVGYNSPKMESDLSPRKTMLVLVIVVGCFAVLWPKVFYPMLVGSANQHIKPSPIDKATGCCDVISETDINTIKIMSELCSSIINSTNGKEIVQKCRQKVLETCGIDISIVLQEQVRLGRNLKQILDQIRSLNGSLCLKYNYGVDPWRLGVAHRVTVKVASDAPNIRQERPHHLRSELIHPAFRERGRAIPQPQTAPPARPPPRVVEGRPGPIPGMRPTIGGAGHVVPPSKQGTSSMSVIMPIYTIGIVIFFTYTLMKIIFKKQPQGVGGTLYPPVDPDPHFRKEVFESESSRLGPRLTRENISSKLGWIERDAIVNAMSALLDEVDQEIEARRKSSEVASQDLVNGNLSNGDVVKPHDDEQPTVKVLGMEMTASCEGGKKWSRPGSPVLPTPSPLPPPEPAPPPQEIYLEGALPAQSQLLVADSAIEPEPSSGENPAVVLSGKMTLSVISPDSENGVEEMENDTSLQKSEETRTKGNNEVVDQIKLSPERNVEETKNVQEVENFAVEEIKNDSSIQIREEIGEKTPEEERPKLELEKDVEDFLKKIQAQNEIQTPSITFASDDLNEMLEVEELEKEVDGLIQEAIENIQQRVEPNEINENSDQNNLDLIDEKSNNIESFINLEQNQQNLEETKLVISKPIHNDINMEIASEQSKPVEDPIQKCQIQNKPNEEIIKHNEETETNESKLDEPLANEELGSDEEVEEIEEIVYEEETEDEEEEEIEIEVEESDEEIPNDVNLNRTESSFVQRVNGERSEDFVDESKYTSVSGATAAENDISDEELTDEEVEEEEIIEVEEDEENDVNHVSDDSEPEL